MHHDSTVAASQTHSMRSRILQFIRRPFVLLIALLLLFASALFVYSQTMAFVWDEGFHLVAAQLIAGGKTPYIDFTFPQTLLNAYLNAGIIRIFGNSWRAVHAFDAFYVIAAVWLTATYVMRRFPDERWRLSCAIAAVCLVGLNTVVLPFGPIAQAYGIGTLFVVVAFRLVIKAVDRPTAWLAFAAGLAAAAAAASTLLTAPALLVFLLWLLWCTRSGSRWTKLVAFIVGAIIPFAPEIWLLLKAPRQTFFNVVQYQAIFRRVNWGDVSSHDFDVFTDWTVSAPTVLLGLLALIGLLFIIKKSNWTPPVRREFYLCAWLSLVMGAYISTAHPTFGRYFIFLIPFTAIPAIAGIYYVGCQLISPGRPRWTIAIVVFIATVSAAKYVFDDRDATNWHDYERIASKIDSVTPPYSPFVADEMVYFLLRRTPPSGMEFSYSHKIQLPAKEEALYHIISQAELKKQIQHWRFDTVETCKDELIDDFKLDVYFPHREDFDDCSVFWRSEAPSHHQPGDRRKKTK